MGPYSTPNATYTGLKDPVYCLAGPSDIALAPQEPQGAMNPTSAPLELYGLE